MLNWAPYGTFLHPNTIISNFGAFFMASFGYAGVTVATLRQLLNIISNTNIYVVVNYIIVLDTVWNKDNYFIIWNYFHLTRCISRIQNILSCYSTASHVFTSVAVYQKCVNWQILSGRIHKKCLQIFAFLLRNKSHCTDDRPHYWLNSFRKAWIWTKKSQIHRSLFWKRL